MSPTKYIYNDIIFDSKPEIAYYIWLTDNNIKFIYKPKTNIQYEFDGKTFNYYPDFYLVETDQLIEIKGDHFFKDDGTMYCPFRDSDWTDEYYYKMCQKYELKHQTMIKNNVKILKSEQYNIYLKYISEKYGKKYLDSFKHT